MHTALSARFINFKIKNFQTIFKIFGCKTVTHYLCRPSKERRVGQGVKTPPFHGGVTGSNPVRGTKSLSDMQGFFH